MSERMEQQLVVKQTALGRMLGGTLISDVAMVGSDMFMREGAAFGLLFEARNAFLLSRDFTTQRAERLKATKGATEETVTIAGKKVSLHFDARRLGSLVLPGRQRLSVRHDVEEA